MGPAIRCTFQRNTASIMKILIFSFTDFLIFDENHEVSEYLHHGSGKPHVSIERSDVQRGFLLKSSNGFLP